MIRWLRLFLLGFFIGLSGVAVYLSPTGFWLEERFGLSSLFLLRGAVKAPADVVVVAIDHHSAKQLNLSIKPRLWPRSLHARLVDRLVAAGARAVIFDLVFDMPSDLAENDEKLAQAIKTAGNVILVERFDYLQPGEPLSGNPGESQEPAHRFFGGGAAPLLPLIADAAKARAPFTLPKTERVFHYWTFKSNAGDIATIPAVVLQINALPLYGDLIRLMNLANPGLAASLPGQADEAGIDDLILTLRNIFVSNPRLAFVMKKELKRGNKLNPEQKKLIRSLIDLYSGDEIHYLNFYGPPRTVTTIPYSQVMELDNDRDAKNSRESIDFRGKTVFVGFSGTTFSEQDIVRDDYPTVFTNREGLYISGVEIMATAYANLLENKPVRPLPVSGSLSIIFLLGFTLAIIFQTLSSRKSILLGLLVITIYTAIAYSFFKQAMIWLPLVIPGALVIFALMLAWLIKVLKLEKFIGGSGPDMELDKIIEEGGQFWGTCLTTDIESYTSLSESMNPSMLERIMMHYRAVLRNAIGHHHGRVIDTTGDSSLSIWIRKAGNSRMPQRLIASRAAEKRQACEAALDLNAAIIRFNKQNNQPLRTRIGLHFGGMSLNKSDGTYRVTGDVVNTANRIQSANKIFKTSILLSYEAVEDLDDFLIRSLGSFLVPGRVKPVKLFELMAYQQSASREQLWLCGIFSRALAAYHSKQWIEATRLFYGILEVFPADGPTHYFLSLCSKYQNQLPEDSWPILRVDSK